MQQLPPDRDGYRLLLKQLAALSPPLFVMGGFAEDALLHHRITRQHGDLDVLIVRSQLNQRLQQLKPLGFAEFEVYVPIAGCVRDDSQLWGDAGQ